uniref:PlsC domain-containing protein n=1 Tax=Heterorhabditis bacteriophora TaxID=37862 RepID=A0A1I7WST6_HETBA
MLIYHLVINKYYHICLILNYDTLILQMLGGSLLEGSRSSHIPRSEDMKASTKIGTAGSDDGQHTTDFRKMIAFIGAAYFLTMTAFIVPVACIATVVLLFPLMWLNMSLFNNLENRLCKFVNDHWVAASAYCGLNVIECGTNLADFTEKRCLFLVNHLGLLDHFVVMQGLHNKDNVPGSVSLLMQYITDIVY